ncbi:MAG: hypothetical protein HKP11_09415 [Flavobacteriaceae bacterium]|nr:hypothetical protein [Flavobacteriaceae bacterium]
MINKSFCIHIYLLLFLFIFIAACNGQDKKNKSEETSVGSDTITKDTTSKVIRNSTLDYENPFNPPTINDSLFFIEGQLCQHLRKIFQDSRGNLWFGTNVYGLMRYDGKKLEYFSKKDGLGGGRITGIIEDNAGNLWIGTYSGLTKFDGETFTNFSKQDGLLNTEIWSLLLDSKGMFWIGTTEGVFRFDGEKFTPFSIPKADVKDAITVYSFNRVSNMMEDKNGLIWFGTDGYGICKYDPSVALKQSGNSFTHLTKEDGLPGNNISGILEDKNGNIWIGTMFGGVSKFDGKTFTNFTQNGVVSGIEVGGFFEDSGGNIWFAAENEGVYRYDPMASTRTTGVSFTKFNSKNGLQSKGVLCIYEDKQGRFWLGGWGGLFRYNPSAALRADGNLFFSVTRDGPWK